MRLVAKVVVITLIAAYLPIPVAAQSSSVSIVSPRSAEVLSGDSAEVSLSYNTSSSTQITHVELDIDGTKYSTKSLSQPSNRGIASFLVDTTKLGNGDHKVVMKVYSGKKLISSTSGGYKVRNKPVDVVGPDVKFIGLRKGQVMSGVAMLEVKTSDIDKDSPLVSIFVDKSLRVIKNVPPYTFAWDTTEVSDGTHTIEVCAYDAAGNRSELGAVDVSVQNYSNSTVAAKPEQPKAAVAENPVKSTASRDQVVLAERPTSTLIPSSSGTKAGAARATEKFGSVSSKANSPITKLDRPVAVVTEAARETPAVSTQSAAAEACQEPKVTAPVMVRPATASGMVESVPSDTAAPVVTVRPSSTDAPSVTMASANINMQQPELKTISTSSAAGQKLATPAMPPVSAVKPVRIAETPRESVPAIQPSREAHKFKMKLETTKQNGVVFTELRSVLESAGGAIIAWDKRTKTVLGVVDGKKLKLKINGKTAVIDAKSIELTSSPYVNDRGRTVVDVRLLKSLVGSRLELNPMSGNYVLITVS